MDSGEEYRNGMFPKVLESLAQRILQAFIFYFWLTGFGNYLLARLGRDPYVAECAIFDTTSGIGF